MDRRLEEAGREVMDKALAVSKAAGELFDFVEQDLEGKDALGHLQALQTYGRAHNELVLACREYALARVLFGKGTNSWVLPDQLWRVDGS